MTRFLTRRLLGGVFTLLLFLTGLFFLVNMLIPGDWTSQFIMDGESRQALRESLGIDRPLAEQYWSWMSSVVSLDLGTSFGGDPVWTAVLDAMATTLFVFAAATVIAFPLGYWLGRASAWNQRRWFTIPNTAVAVVLFTAFPPAVAFLLERGVTNVLSAQAFRNLTQLDADRWAETVHGPFGSDEVADEIGAALSVPEVLWRMLAISAVLLGVVLLVRWATRIIFDRRLPPGVMAALIAVGAAIGCRRSTSGRRSCS
jgi:ABC-type dipeptide/oligopeptide/nickel transport system permease subunit